MANEKKTITLKGLLSGKTVDLMPKTTTDNVLLDDESKLTDKLAEIDNKLPFSLGIDENGNCGFIKPGEDTLTPFGSGGSTSRTVGSIEQLQMANVAGLTSTIEAKVLEYDYIIQTASTGGKDASVSINGTTYLYSDVKSNPVMVDNSLELSYTNLNYSWILTALTNLQNSVSGISYSQNDTIETWSHSSNISIMLKKE